LVQFYNNDGSLTSYNSIFVSDTGGAVAEIAAYVRETRREEKRRERKRGEKNKGKRY
jgi:hypothetical protein